MRTWAFLSLVAALAGVAGSARAEEPAAPQAAVVVGPAPSADGADASGKAGGAKAPAAKAPALGGKGTPPGAGAAARAVARSPKAEPAKGKGAKDRSSSKAASRDALPPGMRWHVVQPKQKLGSIAKRYRVALEALLHANDLTRRDRLKPGVKLLVPARGDEDGSLARAVRVKMLGVEPRPERSGDDEVVLAKADASGRERPGADTRKAKSDPKKDGSWLPYVARPKRKGVVTLLGRDDEWKGRLVGRSGKVVAKARRELETILASSEEHPIDDELLALVAKVSDTFGGRPLHVVSGYRSAGADRSRHRQGRALDFSIEGVPLEALRDFCKSLERVGVGYYPTSRFVHLDVRDRWTYWVDVSGNGEEPRYTETWSKPRGDEDEGAPVRVR